MTAILGFAARQTLACGLVGEGVGSEFLSWCLMADLPDQVVVEAPSDPSAVPTLPPTSAPPPTAPGPSD